MQTSRRLFLKQSLMSAGSLTTAASLGLNLTLSRAVMAQSSARFNDYKALVCVFLYGGNDSFNMLVPTDPNDYSIYQGVRQSLAYPRETLLPLASASSSAYAVGLPPSAAPLQELFNAEKLAFVSNIGPMQRPLSKAMLLNDNSLLPPQLFSHNDQQALWQAGSMNTGSRTGWGGRMADLLYDSNDSLSMNLTLFGNNLLQAGTQVVPFAVSPDGPEAFAALDPNQPWDAERIDLFNRMLELSANPLERAYARKLTSAANNNARILTAIESVSPTTTSYPEGNDLAAQLRMVATLIASQPVLGQSRQIYFVGLGGWDTHDAQAQLHPQLIATLSHALKAFQDDIDERGLGDSVVTFTASEFGRTLTSNGDGTDHGWGGHQLVMGGPVDGGSIKGQLPSLALNSDDDIGDGRMIPTLALEHLGSELAAWFGLSDNELAAVFPNLGEFDRSALQLF